MSVNTNPLLKDISSKPFCFNRTMTNAKDPNTRIKFNIGCIPKTATNANQAKCAINIFNITVSPTDADCSIITSNGWANAAVKMDAATTDCLATCSVIAGPASNSTSGRPSSSNTTINANASSMASTAALPNYYVITFATLLFVYSLLFSKRAIM